MPSIRYRAHGWVCCVPLFEVPDGETAYVKNKLKQTNLPNWSPVRWMGFVPKPWTRKMSWARPGKLVATSVSNGNGFSGQWRDLDVDEYVVAMLVQIDDETFGVYAVVDDECWPIVRRDGAPRLAIVTTGKAQIFSMVKKRA